MPAVFKFLDQKDDQKGDRHIEQGGGQECFIGTVVAGVDDPGCAGYIDDGDDAGQ